MLSRKEIIYDVLRVRKRDAKVCDFLCEATSRADDVRGGIRQGWLNIRLLEWSLKLSGGTYLLYQ